MSSTLDQDLSKVPPTEVDETQTSSVARMLELAGITADRLVNDAGSEAEALVSAAQAKADAILAASRKEAEEQSAALDRERVTALAQLSEEKAALEAQVAALRELDKRHRDQMRQLLTEQLSVLDADLPEAPAD